MLAMTNKVMDQLLLGRQAGRGTRRCRLHPSVGACCSRCWMWYLQCSASSGWQRREAGLLCVHSMHSRLPRKGKGRGAASAAVDLLQLHSPLPSLLAPARAATPYWAWTRAWWCCEPRCGAASRRAAEHASLPRPPSQLRIAAPAVSHHPWLCGLRQGSLPPRRMPPAMRVSVKSRRVARQTAGPRQSHPPTHPTSPTHHPTPKIQPPGGGQERHHCRLQQSAGPGGGQARLGAWEAGGPGCNAPMPTARSLLRTCILLAGPPQTGLRACRPAGPPGGGGPALYWWLL